MYDAVTSLGLIRCPHPQLLSCLN